MSANNRRVLSWNLEAQKPPLGRNKQFPWRSSAILEGDPGGEFSNNCELAVMRFGAAQEMGTYHIHHKCDNLYVLFEGTMTSIIGGVRFTTKAGEAIFMPRDVPHATGNFADEEVYLWELYNPNPSLPDGTKDSYPVDLPAEIVDTTSGVEGGVRIWNLNPAGRDLTTSTADPWRSSKILAGGGNPAARDTVTDKTEIVLQVFSRGADRLGEYHRHNHADVIWVVLEGEINSVVNGERYEAGAGEVLFIAAGEPHSVGTFHHEGARALMVCTPSRFVSGSDDTEHVDMPNQLKP